MFVGLFDGKSLSAFKEELEHLASFDERKTAANAQEQPNRKRPAPLSPVQSSSKSKGKGKEPEDHDDLEDFKEPVPKRKAVLKDLTGRVIEKLYEESDSEESDPDKTSQPSESFTIDTQTLTELSPATKVLPFEEGEIFEKSVTSINLSEYEPIKLYFLSSATLDLEETKHFFFKVGFTSSDNTVLFVVRYIVIIICY